MKKFVNHLDKFIASVNWTYVLILVYFIVMFIVCICWLRDFFALDF